MLLKLTSLVLSLLFSVQVLTLSSRAQLISSEIYETEEDLQEGLDLGLLTFDQYLELLDLIQSKMLPTSEEVDKLEFVPDVSSVDVSQIKKKDKNIDLNQKTDAFLSPESTGEKVKKKRIPLFSGKLTWRLYEKFPEGDRMENYLLCEIANGEHVLWHIEGEKKVNSSEAISTRGDFQFRRRFVKFMLPPYSTEIIIGNFDKRIGLGLNVGYHPHLGYDGGSEVRFKDTFLYPTLGRFNGIYGQSTFKSLSTTIFYSANKRGKIEDKIGAWDLGLEKKNMKVGLCLSKGKLKNIENKNTFEDDCQSLYFNLKLEPIKFSGEYARLSNNSNAVAFDLHSTRKWYSFDFSWWRYEDDFIHSHGGGISNPDYETVSLKEIDYQFRSRQAGERGIFFKSRYYPIEKLNLNFSYNQWKEKPYLPEKMKLKIGAGYEFSTNFSFMLYQQWSDYDVEGEEIDQSVSSLNLFFSPRSRLDFSFISNYRSATDKDYGDLRLKIRTRIFSPFDFILWLKYNDPNFSRSADEYFSFHVQEKIQFFENYFVSAEYMSKFYQDESKANTKAIRVRMEVVW